MLFTILWLPDVLSINVYSLLYETGSLANILFFAALTNSNTNTVPILAIQKNEYVYMK